MNKNNKNKKIIPKDVSTEKKLLGRILINPADLLKINEYITPQCFYKKSHRYIYETILSLLDAYKPIDIITVSEELMANNKLNEVGGRTYINDLATFALDYTKSSYTEDYAQILFKNQIKRALISAGKKILSLGYNTKSIDESIDIADKLISNIAFLKINNNTILTKDLAAEIYCEIDQHYTNNDKIVGYSTGFTELDQATKGLQPSDLIVIASRPSVGKSTLAMNIAQHVAIKEKKAVLIFSLEKSKKQLITRLLASEAELEVNKIASGDLSQQDWISLSKAMEDMYMASIWIDDTPNSSLIDVKAKCRRVARKEKGLGLIVIDYIQLMTRYKVKGRGRDFEVLNMLPELKNLARELNVPIIVLSQSEHCGINYQCRIYPDFCDFGIYEEYADIVLFIRKYDYAKREKLGKKNKCEILITKNRHNEPCEIELEFKKDIAKFKNAGDITNNDKSQSNIIKRVFDAKEV